MCNSGDILRNARKLTHYWCNIVMALAWSIVLAAAAWEGGANDEEAKEANADNKLANSWR